MLHQTPLFKWTKKHQGSKEFAPTELRGGIVQHSLRDLLHSLRAQVTAHFWQCVYRILLSIRKIKDKPTGRTEQIFF